MSDGDDFDAEKQTRSDDLVIDVREVEAINEGVQAMERGQMTLLQEFDLAFRNRTGISLS